MQLAVQSRTVFRKGLRALRAQGLVPGEVYGHGFTNVHISVPARELMRLLADAGTTTVFDLAIDGTPHRALIHAVQHDHTSPIPQSVDVHVVKKGEKVVVDVPIVFVDEAPAVRDLAAVVTKQLHEVSVEAAAEYVPHQLELSLASLHTLTDTLHVRDLSVPKGVRMLTEPDLVIVALSAQREEEVTPAAPTDLSAIPVAGERTPATEA